MTLALTYEDLAGEAGHYLGYTRGEVFGDSPWDVYQTKTVIETVRTGYSWFIIPPVLPGERQSHEWSFMRPTLTLNTISGQETIALPDDFGGCDSPIIVDDGVALTVTTEMRLRQMHAANEGATGAPRMVAIISDKTPSKVSWQKQQFLLYPTPDAVYTLELNYYFIPDALSEPKPYALGGPQHASTIKAAVIAAAELEQDDVRGPRYEMFLERLRASISFDRHRKPRIVGRLRKDLGIGDTREWRMNIPPLTFQ